MLTPAVHRTTIEWTRLHAHIDKHTEAYTNRHRDMQIHTETEADRNISFDGNR